MPCVVFSEAKGWNVPVPGTIRCRSTNLPERLFVGLSGKSLPSADGSEYPMMIADDFSRFGWTYLLKKKSDDTAVLASFLADVRAQSTPFTMTCLRSDHGTGFTNQGFVSLLNRHGIRRECTPVDSPKHDGVVERGIDVTLEFPMATRLGAPRLIGGLPLPPIRRPWAEACTYAADVLNMTARARDKPDMLPPHHKRYCRAPFPRLLPFLKPGFHHVSRTLKSEANAQACVSFGAAAETTRQTVAISYFRPSARRTPGMPLGSIRERRSLGCYLRRGEKAPRRRRRRWGCRNSRKAPVCDVNYGRRFRCHRFRRHRRCRRGRRRRHRRRRRHETIIAVVTLTATATATATTAARVR